MSERRRGKARKEQSENPLGYHETDFKGHAQHTCDTCGASFIVPEDGSAREIQQHLQEHDQAWALEEKNSRRQVVSALVDAQGRAITHTVTISTPPEGGEVVMPAEEDERT